MVSWMNGALLSAGRTKHTIMLASTPKNMPGYTINRVTLLHFTSLQRPPTEHGCTNTRSRFCWALPFESPCGGPQSSFDSCKRTPSFLQKDFRDQPSKQQKTSLTFFCGNCSCVDRLVRGSFIHEVRAESRRIHTNGSTFGSTISDREVCIFLANCHFDSINLENTQHM